MKNPQYPDNYLDNYKEICNQIFELHKSNSLRETPRQRDTLSKTTDPQSFVSRNVSSAEFYDVFEHIREVT